VGFSKKEWTELSKARTLDEAKSIEKRETMHHTESKRQTGIRYVSVREIRWAHDVVKYGFRDVTKGTIDDLVNALQQDATTLTRLPIFEVVHWNGRYYVKSGNRRLTALKIYQGVLGEELKVGVKLSVADRKFDKKMNSICQGTHVIVRRPDRSEFQVGARGNRTEIKRAPLTRVYNMAVGDVGRLIGLRGRTIQRLRENSGAGLGVEQATINHRLTASLRVCGSMKEIDKVVSLVNNLGISLEFVERQPSHVLRGNATSTD